MGITVLGPLTVDGSGRLSPRDRVVLQALAACAGRPVSSDQLVDALWGDSAPASAAKVLQGCIVRLRKELGPDAIDTTANGYVLALPADHVDALRFERLVVRARELLTLGEADRAAFQLTEALGLWRGSAYAELSDWAPAAAEARRLEELRAEAEELRVEAHLRSGRHREVLAQAHALVREAPLRERRWTLLALAQYQSGNQGEALRTLHGLKTVLLTQLGIDPGPDVVALEQAILRQDASLLAGNTVISGSACPWQGLQAYDVGDADRFFGRDDAVDACLDIVRRTSFLALVGPSGSGKSSILRAGVGAALRGRGVPVVTITPGRHPLQALSLLDRASSVAALCVDQAEEVFSLCDDDAERQEFLQRVADETLNRPVAVAMRADRLADVAAHASFSRMVEQGLYLVGALSDAGLRQAVEGPARQVGLILEPGLVDLLVREVQGDPGALPLLSHALLETWKRREGSTLTVEGYQASGGIHGAVAKSAERLYASVETENRPVLRDLLLRLVSPGAHGEPVRAQVPRRSIATDDERDRLVELLVAARLLTSDDGVLELSHEALARAWPRLRGWLDDDIDGQRILHHLSASADAWDTMGRPSSELYRGVRLARALEWRAQTRSAVTTVETEFLAAAEAAAEDEQRSAERTARAQARLIRRLRVVLAGAVVLLVLALAAGGLAAVQSERANDNAARARGAAESARLAAVSADARRVGARAQLTDEISLSLLLAAAGVRLDDSPETRTNLLTALGKRPLLVRSAQPGGGYLDIFDVSRDGRWIASSDDRNRMHLYDAATNRPLDSYDAGRQEEGPWVLAGSFSPDSRQLAVILHGSESTEPVRLLDPSTMEPTTKLPFPGGRPVWGVDVRFSGDGRYLAATVQTVHWPSQNFSEAPSYAVVWDLRSPSTPPRRVLTGPGVQGLALSPDGRTLYTGWPLTAYDVTTGKRIWRRRHVTTWYIALDVNREGTLLALGDTGHEHTRKNAILVDATTGETVRTLRGHRDTVNDVRFSPDGSLVGSVSNDGELIVWDTATGRPLERWDTFDPYSVGFGPDNDLVYGGGADSMLRTWDLSQQDTLLRRTTQVGDADTFASAHLSPDGEQVAYRWVDDHERGWVRFVDTGTGNRTSPTRLPASEDNPWIGGDWHPEGGRYVGYCDGGVQCATPGRVRVLDSVTGELIQERDVVEGDGDIYALAYVNEGRSQVVVHGPEAFGSELKTSIVDAETLLPRGEPFAIRANCCATSVGDVNTAMVYEAFNDLETGRWRVFDVTTGEVLSSGEAGLLYTSIASPDGSTVAMAGEAGDIVTVDVSTGAELRRSVGLGAGVYWLNFSDDGELLVSGSEDGGVSLWDARTLDLLGTVRPPHLGDPVPASAQFIGDTHDVAIASYDGRIYRWETDLDRALEFACQMAGRDLTKEEWAQYLPAQPYRSVCPQE